MRVKISNIIAYRNVSLTRIFKIILSDIDVTLSLNMQTENCSKLFRRTFYLFIRLEKILSISPRSFYASFIAWIYSLPTQARTAAWRGAVRSFFSAVIALIYEKTFCRWYPRFYTYRHVHFSGRFSAPTDTWILYPSWRNHKYRKFQWETRNNE